MKTPPARQRIVMLISLLTAFTAMVTCGQSPTDGELIPTIQFEGIPLAMGIENLARQAGMNYGLSPLVPNSPVTKTWKNISARAALTNLLAEHKLFLVENPATSVTLISSTNRIVTPVDPKWIAADTNRPLSLIQFADMSLDLVFTDLSHRRETGLTVDSRIGSDTAVTLRWENLKPRQAIAALCENYNLVLTTNAAGGAHIAPK